MTTARTTLTVGDRVLLNAGLAVVTRLTFDAVEVKQSDQTTVLIPFTELTSAIEPGSTTTAAEVRPWYDQLPARAQTSIVERLEVVQEILTGYRDGLAELARPGEPRYPFGPDSGKSVTAQAREMAQLLTRLADSNPTTQRRRAYGELGDTPTSARTVQRWVQGYQDEGVRGLVDGRSTRGTAAVERVDALYRAAAEALIDQFDGNRSLISHKEFDRRVRKALRSDGVTDLVTPERATKQYVSELMKANGSTTRANKSKRLRDVATYRSFPALRPGQIVAVDATGSDNLCADHTGRPHSVEILTAIDVASRVVLALRVVPQSANAHDLGLLLYDVMRPFAMVVDGTEIGQWRWCGVPGAIDLTDATAHFRGPGRGRQTVPGRPIDGVHTIPSVLPDGFRCDRGSINVSNHIRHVLHSFGIDVLPNRGGKSNDNAHIERWWETIQAALQQLPGYKGRNVSERGRLVADEPLLTAALLQEKLRRWVALEYNTSQHTGIRIPKLPDANLSPIEAFDALLHLTGRIDVPQRADLLYQFLPLHLLTPSHAGVEHRNLAYDAPVLDDFRTVFTDQYGPGRKLPFHIDPGDLNQIWLRHPVTGAIHEIPWRGRDLIDAPLTDKLVDLVRRRVRERGGNTGAYWRRSEEFVDQLDKLMCAPASKTTSALLCAAHLRTQQARIDHAEADEAAQLAAPTDRQQTSQPPVAAVSLDDPWPDYIGGTPR